MKKILSVALVLALLLTLAACGGSGASKMTMGTGGTTGTYYPLGGDIANLYNIKRMLYILVGKLGNVNKSVLMYADINECTEVDNVSDGSRQYHSLFKRIDIKHVVTKQRCFEIVADIASGLFKLVHYIV